MESKKCPKCGSIQVAIANYCSKCATALSDPHPLPPQASVRRPVVARSGRTRKEMGFRGVAGILIGVVVLLGLGLFGILRGGQKFHDYRSPYTLVNDKSRELPNRSFRILQRFAVSEMPTEDELETEILQLYRAAQTRRGPRYHSRPRGISIFVYPTEEHARETTHPIARLNWHQKDKKGPSVTIYQKKLAFFSQPPAPETRFGLSEDERKQVYFEDGLAETRALLEAQDALNALPMPVTKRQFKENDQLYVKLKETYKNQLARKYGLTRDQFEKISLEGWRKYWISGVYPGWG